MHALYTHDQTSSPLLRNKLAAGGITELIFMFTLYFESNQGMQAGVENGAMLTTVYSDILQNEPFRSQIFGIFFAWRTWLRPSHMSE